MSETLHTDRLILRPISPDHATDLFQVYRDSRAMKFMATPPHQTEEETRAELTLDMSLQGAHGWAICLKEDDHPIGYVNFLGQTPIPGMGYILHPDYWGRGITPEACRAALTYGFGRLGYDRVELWINEDNVSSIRVAQKLGFKLKGLIPQKYNHQKDHHIMLVFGKAVVEEDLARRFFRVVPVLTVADVAKTASYYRDTLGFRIDFTYGNPLTYAGVAAGAWTGSGMTIHLSQGTDNQAINPSGFLRILVGTGLDTLFETYRQKGVTIVSDPVSRPWGMRDFIIRDCDGHNLRFETNV